MNDSVDDEHKYILPHRFDMKEFMVGSATESDKKKKTLKKKIVILKSIPWARIQFNSSYEHSAGCARLRETLLANLFAFYVSCSAFAGTVAVGVRAVREQVHAAIMRLVSNI